MVCSNDMKMSGHNYISKQQKSFIFAAIVQTVDDDLKIDFILKYWKPCYNGTHGVIESGFFWINTIFFHFDFPFHSCSTGAKPPLLFRPGAEPQGDQLKFDDVDTISRLVRLTPTVVNQYRELLPLDSYG